MMGTGEPAVTGAGDQTAENVGEEFNTGDELSAGEDLSTDEKLEGQEEHCPREETAEQRRQRRLLRELVLRAMI